MTWPYRTAHGGTVGASAIMVTRRTPNVTPGWPAHVRLRTRRPT
jgi:hypothetical protein